MDALDLVDPPAMDGSDNAGAAPAAATPAEARHASVGLLEVVDRDGHVRQAWPIREWPASVGRGLNNDVYFQIGLVTLLGLAACSIR